MFVSVFDLFKIGVGPSSSHTMGPTLAAGRFVRLVQETPGCLSQGCRMEVSLFGSLAHTGVGHGTLRAVTAGLLGFMPEQNPEEVSAAIGELSQGCTLSCGMDASVGFDPETSFNLDKTTRKNHHPNALAFSIVDGEGTVALEETYYSVGGGFVLCEKEMEAASGRQEKGPEIPFAFHSAGEMLAMGEASGKSIAEMKRANEETLCSASEIEARLADIWAAMDACIARGLAARGELPGGLKVKRRAGGMFEALSAERGRNAVPLHSAIDWISAYAMAVNEENAAGGQVVTAPTNGAAGVLPAVIRYYLEHMPDADKRNVPDMLLCAAAIGGLIKYNASISGAEVGCQGEVGSASAMAAAALCLAMGGSNAQIENAAEIALEHHLGMTCDPVAGLVQIPCIERNGMGAVKAVAAASLAMHGDGSHKVSLDQCIETMRATGADMDERYKETSLGGLSVSVVEC
ncbi:MAG TPA: L-serine ammonia-lyase [Devosia sp.]|nr:L-serine ammonia-lyase [Devosia sp.]